MGKITIDVPDAMQRFEHDLDYFFNTMVRKLYLNRHKGFADGIAPAVLVSHLHGELEELHDAMQTKDQFSVLVESADVANMAFLCGLSVLRLTRPEFDANKKENKNAIPF
jgi:hypothetical protein